jgi:uncharacterized surface protein with fasciclin (FAS1) repeats
MKKNKKLIIAITIFIIIACGLLGFIYFGGKSDDKTIDEPTVSKIDSTQSASEIIAKQDTFSKFSTALSTNGLLPELEGQVTVFAPNDQAFNNLPETTKITESLDKKIAGYHIAKGLYITTELTDGQKIPTLGGLDLVVLKQDDAIYLLDAKGNKVKILSSDLKTKDGYIQEVGQVFIPQ